jgi:hypothetical protein
MPAGGSEPDPGKVAREFRSINTTFRRLAASFGRLARLWERAAATSQHGATPRRKSRLSAQLRAHMKLQGRYIGTMRNLPATKRAMVKKIRAEKGIMVAIAAARKMASYLTKDRRAELKLHGQYIGTIRGLEPRQRAKVKAIRAANGVRAAIAEARRLAS